MSFPPEQRSALLELKGVGPSVIEKFEAMGIMSFAQLSTTSVHDVVSQAAFMAGATSWKTSPRARAVIKVAIDLAQNHCPSENAASNHYSLSMG